MKKVILNVEGMSCGHCVSAVEGAVNELEGVSGAKVNLEENNVTVEFDELTLNEDAIKAAIEEQGYDVVA